MNSLAKLEQDDPCLLSLIRDRYLHRPSEKKLNLDAPIVDNPSMGQSQSILDILGKDKVYNIYMYIYKKKKKKKKKNDLICIEKINFNYQKKKKENGFFIECGALDGQVRSNTLFMEQHLGWQGVLIEADPKNYKKLLEKNRRSWSVPACLSTSPTPKYIKSIRKCN